MSRRIARRLGPVALLAVPPPHRAWLTLSNDPDATTWAAWEELDALIWRELKLPWADSFFLTSVNEHEPEQVCVERHPAILDAHPHDTMHTWGDHTFSRSYRFSREEAERGLRLLRERGVVPRVWTDHADSRSNMLHRGGTGGTPQIRDASGHIYENFCYTLDLARDAGVRYVWDGEETARLIGQDRRVGRRTWYGAIHGGGWRTTALAGMDALLAPLLRRLKAGALSWRPDANRCYRPRAFDDGRTLYLFRRYGPWEWADIDGFGKAIAPPRVDELVSNEGVCIAYTHLGKRRADRKGGAHVPPATREALEHVRRRHDEEQLRLSPTSELLDYLVLRDHAALREGALDFRADGVRFTALEPKELERFSFGVAASRNGLPRVTCDGKPMKENWDEVEPGVFRLGFDG